MLGAGPLEHRDVVRVIDPATWDSDVPGVMWHDPEHGEFFAYHVTDAPERLQAFLERGGHLIKAYGPKGQHAELGPGLYLSGNPRYWVGRSSDKWSFLPRLSPVELDRLVAALEREAERLYAQRHLTGSEYDVAIRDLGYVRDGLYGPEALLFLASLPYAVPFWEPKFLEPLGIAPGQAPAVLKVWLKGSFAELNRTNPSAQALRFLRRAGLDGAFTRASMGTNPELVVWNPEAVTAVVREERL